MSQSMMHVACFGDSGFAFRLLYPESDAVDKQAAELSAASLATVRAALRCAQDPNESHEQLVALLTAAEFAGSMAAAMHAEIAHQGGAQ